MTDRNSPPGNDPEAMAEQAALPFEAELRPEENPDAEASVLDEILATVRHIAQREDDARSRGFGEVRADIAKLAGTMERIDKRTKETKSELEQRPMGGGGSRAIVKAAKQLEKGIKVYAADLDRLAATERRGRRRWSALAIAAGFPAFLLLGVLAEQQFQVIPLHDPTGGWRGHVWKQYGRKIVDCATEAMTTDTEIDCPLVVRRP